MKAHNFFLLSQFTLLKQKLIASATVEITLQNTSSLEALVVKKAIYFFVCSGGVAKMKIKRNEMIMMVAQQYTVGEMFIFQLMMLVRETKDSRRRREKTVLLIFFIFTMIRKNNKEENVYVENHHRAAFVMGARNFIHSILSLL